jgi:hypothetical protein
MIMPGKKPRTFPISISKEPMTKPLTNQSVGYNMTDGAHSEPSDQLSLFPNHRLYSVPSGPVLSKRRPIRLPRSILVIRPNEQLHQYLSRIAAEAMSAAAKSYGSAALAALRLGTADTEDPEPATAQSTRPKLA